jgi:hypothetical protein
MTMNWARAAAAAGALYAARRYYRNWGTTKDECRMQLPGDELIKRPITRTTEGVSIEAPAEAVWGQLLQRIHPEQQTVVPGDVIRLVPRGRLGLRRGMELAVEQVVDGSALVLSGARPNFPWQTVMSFHVLPRLEDRCRLLIRTRTALRHPGEVLLVELAGPAMAMLMRRMLVGIKNEAEGARRSHRSELSIGL